MTIIAYETWNPTAETLSIIEQANAICEDYRRQGYDLTLRQLYYQFVARGLIPNTMQSYKRLGSIVNQARMAGLMSWAYIVDRTRNLGRNSHWSNPADIIQGAAAGYAIDKWTDQPTRVEVWVEKEALSGIVEQVADAEDCAWFACRGYVSQSELWRAGLRFARYLRAGQRVLVLHLGDHDPSGIDMTRDMRDRLNLFMGHPSPGRFEFRRIALTRAQVDEYEPPPNPAKLTDSRVGGYLDAHGDESWELDALPPDVLTNLIRDGIRTARDDVRYRAKEFREDTDKRLLQTVADRWEAVAEYVATDPDEDDE